MPTPKLKLDLDALAVESFDVDARSIRRGGTVLGRDSYTCLPAEDEIETMANTCQQHSDVCTANTGCGQETCGCGTGGPSEVQTCGLTFCVDSCAWCKSLMTDHPYRC